MYTDNLHDKLRQITDKNHGFTIEERIGYFDPRIFTFSAVSELLDEIERLKEELKERKENETQSKND